ncbi:MAG: hypothetical protein KAI80_07020 [Hyphomicrobiaceae bacterium]|nr:hypothetical protein [Hyphomicrobiaceae bacterium]
MIKRRSFRPSKKDKILAVILTLWALVALGAYHASQGAWHLVVIDVIAAVALRVWVGRASTRG